MIPHQTQILKALGTEKHVAQFVQNSSVAH